MNGRIAKKIRRAVYGDFSFRHRVYFRKKAADPVQADFRRRDYQTAKREYSKCHHSNKLQS